MQDKFNLRFPDGMRDQIAEAAKESGRSMNAEIIHRLQRTFDLDDPTKWKLKRKEKTQLPLDRPRLNDEEQAEFNELTHQIYLLMQRSKENKEE